MKNLKSITASLLFALAFVACKKASSQDAQLVSLPAPAGLTLVPAKGVLLGHYYGNGTISETDSRIGRRPPIHLSYYGWTDHWAKTESTRQDLADGRIPLIN